jgi:hypothetical protein
MRINKYDIPTVIDAPGAVARQIGGFGDAGEAMAGEYFSLGAGVDITPLLEGLPGGRCQAPHWGYLLEGVVIVTLADGTEETVVAGDLFHWPPGHTVRVEDDAELILFSPTASHRHVLDHLKEKMGLPA